jgi:hypothetical protein
MASKPNEGDQEDLGSATALTIERRLFGLRNVFLILPSHKRHPFFPPIMGMVTQLLLACFVLLLFPFASFTDFTGPVVSDLDGDTIEVLSMGSVWTSHLSTGPKLRADLIRGETGQGSAEKER